VDETVGTLGLQIAALLLAVVFTWFLSKKVLAAEIRPALARVIHPLCKYVTPAVLIVTTAALLLSGTDFPGMRNLPGGEFISAALQAELIAAIILALLAIILAACYFRSCPLARRFHRER